MFQPHSCCKLPLCISLTYFKEIIVYHFILSKEWGRGIRMLWTVKENTTKTEEF